MVTVSVSSLSVNILTGLRSDLWSGADYHLMWRLRILAASLTSLTNLPPGSWEGGGRAARLPRLHRPRVTPSYSVTQAQWARIFSSGPQWTPVDYSSGLYWAPTQWAPVSGLQWGQTFVPSSVCVSRTNTLSVNTALLSPSLAGANTEVTWDLRSLVVRPHLTSPPSPEVSLAGWDVCLDWWC